MIKISKKKKKLNLKFLNSYSIKIDINKVFSKKLYIISLAN